jgi:Flp pilus assembly protein CpaB
MLRVALLVLAALGLGVFAGVGSFVIQEQNTKQALAEYEQTLALFTDEDIPAGTSLKQAREQGLVTNRNFPKALLPIGTVLEYGDLDESSVATRDLTADSLLLEGDFEPMTATQKGSILDTGFAAVSLSLDESQRGGGLLDAGSNVGVLSTQTDPETGVKSVSVLFPSVSVLAVAGIVADLGVIPNSGTSLEGIVTLSVPTRNVARLLADYANGEITLVLLGSNQSLPQSQN